MFAHNSKLKLFYKEQWTLYISFLNLAQSFAESFILLKFLINKYLSKP